MSKKFLKINVEFHFNVITYNQTNEYVYTIYTSVPNVPLALPFISVSKFNIK